MKKRKNNNDIGKYAIIPIVLIVLIIGYFIYTKYRENYNYLKEDISKSLIYTISKEQHGSYYQYKPYINLKDRIGAIANNDINDYLNNFKKDNVLVTYDYDLSGKVLSLILRIEDYTYAESTSVHYFRSYNINLDTLEILSKEQLLSYYEMSNQELENIINNQLHDYYNELLSNDNIDKRCDYNCFLKSREFTEGIEDAEYHVRDSKLVVYKPYISMNEKDVKEFIIN